MGVGDRLRSWVREDFGVELTALDEVADGADAAADVWRGIAPDGSRYAVKWSGAGTPAGLLLSARLARHGAAGIVAPATTRSGGLWSEREGRRLSLLPWVSDDGALDGAMTARRWSAFGALLARVHATPASDPVVRRLPREEHRHQRWVTAVRAVGDRLGGLGEAPDGAGDELVRALAEEWRAAAGVVARLVERADALGRALRDRPVRRVVCHGDPHLGNVLVGDDEGVWLIDWDDAVLAPRERDLLFVIGGVLPFAPVSEQELGWFFDGYGPADVDPARLAYHRCVRALEDLADPAAEVVDLAGRTDRQRADALAIFRSVLSPTGLARLALGHGDVLSAARGPCRSGRTRPPGGA